MLGTTRERGNGKHAGVLASLVVCLGGCQPLTTVYQGWRCEKDDDCVDGYACNTSVGHCEVAGELCIDADGDAYGIGEGCQGVDCDDTADTCTTDCASRDADTVADCQDTCVDKDEDGFGDGTLGNTGCRVTASDVDDDDASRCNDTDADNCDDCSSGAYAPDKDGVDGDHDGICDASDDCNDVDDDGIGDGTTGDNSGCVALTNDTDDGNPHVCIDADADGCDDCTVTGGPPATDDDGPDGNADGICDFFSWLDPAWDHRKHIAINHLQVVESQSNFPVLVLIDAATDVAMAARGDGNDIVFTDSDGRTVLDHEIERWKNSQLVAWVRLPQVSATTDTIFYMYYGNAAATNQENPVGVWDENFVAVWHFDQMPPEQMLNSTRVSNVHGTPSASMTASASVEGKIGKGLDFVNADDLVDVGSESVIDDLSALTFEAWILWRGEQDAASPVPHRRIYAKSKNDSPEPHTWYFLREGSDTVNLRLQRDRDGHTQNMLIDTDGQPLRLNQHGHVAVLFDVPAGRFDLYVNGAKAEYQAATTLGANALDSDAAYSFVIGNRTKADKSLNGVMDEVRLSAVARSEGWIKTSHANQSAPEGFCIVGSEESVPRG